MNFKHEDKLFEYFMSASKDLIFIKDLEHRYIKVNSAFLNMMSKTNEEVIGRKDEEIFAQSVAQRHIELDLIVFNEQRELEICEWVSDVEEKQYFLEIKKIPLYDDQGQLIGLMGHSRDLTQRKIMEDNLHDRDLYLNGLIEGMEQGLAVHEIICNEEGIPCDYRFLEINPQFEKMTGLHREDLIGKTVLEVLPETESYWIEVYGKVALTGEIIRYENVSETIGKIFSVYAFSPKERQFAVLIEDVTQRKQYEEDLIRERLKAENASLAKDQFLANMSHEIRTPINGITGLTDLLLTTKLTEDQKLYLDMVKKSSLALMDVIEDILEYIGLTNDGTSSLHRPLSLKILTEEINDLYTFSMKQKGLNFTIHLDETCPKWVSGDSVKMKQILASLIGNALKFTNNGDVSLNVYSSLKEAGHVDIIFEVKDTGICISETVQESMFSFFEQGDSTIKKHYQGLGLGLSRVTELCRTLGASITVESQLGVGSAFKVRIPMEIVEQSSIELGEIPILNVFEPVSDQMPKSILVVEDDTVSRVFVELILKSVGYKVVSVEGGQSAIDLLNEMPIDLILMDLHLPDMDGFEITNKIRNQLSENLRSVPIIAITGYASEANRIKSRHVGMNDFLSKPVDKAQLMPMMKRWIK